jgi:hypothetical protein
MAVVEDVRQVLQDFLAPELREIKQQLKRVDEKIDDLKELMEVRFTALEDKLDLHARLTKVETEMKQRMG